MAQTTIPDTERRLGDARPVRARVAAATAGTIGGLALFCDLALQAFGPLGRSYFPAQLIAQLTFFPNGQDSAPGPNGVLLGTWGLCWAWAAWTSAGAKRHDGGRP